MTSADVDLAAEHEKGLHKQYFQPPTCGLCFPAGPPERPAPAPSPVPGLSVAQHSYRKSFILRAPDGSAVCECGQPQEGHPSAIGNLGRTLSGILAQRASADSPAAEAPDDSNNLLGDGGPPCATCRGTRKLRQELPISHAEFGKLIDCTNADCAAFVAQQRLRKLLGELPEGLRDWTLDRFVSDYPRRELGVQLAERGRLWMTDGRRPWLYLHGRAGRGKTVLGVCLLAAQLALPGRSGTFQVAGEVLRTVRGTYRTKEAYANDERDILVALRNADLLLLDDLGKETSSDWAIDLLGDVVSGRRDQRRQTIITSNWSLDQLGDRIGIPTASRIAEMTPSRFRWDFSTLDNLRVDQP